MSYIHIDDMDDNPDSASGSTAPVVSSVKAFFSPNLDILKTKTGLTEVLLRTIGAVRGHVAIGDLLCIQC